MVTMQDIAEQAGVSKGTVSYVLNNKHEKARINAKTCAKVKKIAKAIGYHRNEIARAVKTGRTQIIAVVGKLTGEFAMEMLNGISAAVSERGYSMKMKALGDNDDLAAVVRNCLEYRISGLICRGLKEHELQIVKQTIGEDLLPTVQIGNRFSHKWCSAVFSDDCGGGKEAIEYLLALGHRKILHISDTELYGFTLMRSRVFTEVMKQHGVKDPERLVCKQYRNAQVNHDPEHPFGLIRQFITEHQPTAIFCSNDATAAKVLNVATQIGLKVPEQLSVVGFGDLSFCSIVWPSLTTVNQPFYDIGQSAAELLYEMIEHKVAPKELLLPTKLVKRNSTGKLTR